MQIEVSRGRWPRDPEPHLIIGPGLRGQFPYCCWHSSAEPPGRLDGEYERSNWLDRYMAGEVWRMIVLGRDRTMGFVSSKCP